MISESSIMKRLQSYANTSAGQKRMKSYIAYVQDSGKKLASGEVVVGVRQMSEMANDLADMIRRRLPASISDIGNSIRVSPPIKTSDGGYQVVLRFDPALLRRDSLENDLGYDGIDNIVALFNNGYHARNYVYGWWNGHRPTGESLYRSGTVFGDYAWVRSEKEREALEFMQDAVSEFYAKYGRKCSVVVELGSDYITE